MKTFYFNLYLSETWVKASVGDGYIIKNNSKGMGTFLQIIGDSDRNLDYNLMFIILHFVTNLITLCQKRGGIILGNN